MISRRILRSSLIVLLALVGNAMGLVLDVSQDGADGVFVGNRMPEVVDGAVTLPATLETRTFPVEAGKKYRLEILAEVEGPFVVEVNDRAHILTLQTHRQRTTSTYEVIFQDASGNAIPAAPVRGGSVGGFFLTNQRKPYCTVFYAPEGAVEAKVRFQANKTTTRVARLTLEEETGEETVNPNPDFRYGELNYCGWIPARDGRLYTRPDGKTVFNAGYGGYSPPFPLQEGKNYRIATAGVGRTINIEYYSKDGKMLQKRFLIRPTPEGSETLLTPPPETAFARIVMYGGIILESFSVFEAK